MREIKFRAWIKKDNMGKPLMFYQGEQYLQSFLRRCVFFSNDEGRDHEKYGDYHLMQWTGLKDKNGKEIYEEDILKSGSDGTTLMRVQWIEKFACFCLVANRWAFPHFFAEAADPDDCEVIGNSFEHPHLLQ